MAVSCSRAVGYSAFSILTIGLSQVVGVIGLLCTGVKAVYDKVQHSRYSKIGGSDAKRKVSHYERRIKDNHVYAKAFGLSLVSLALCHSKGYLEDAAAIAISDVALGILGPARLRRQFYHLSGSSSVEIDQKTKDAMKKLNGERVKLPIKMDSGQRTIDGYWITADKANAVGRSVILFHGTASVLDHMAGHADWYKKRGFNVLMVTMGGYPQSDPSSGGLIRDGITTTEDSTYADAEAAVAHVKEKTRSEDEKEAESKVSDNDRIVLHGNSMGTTLALHAFFRNTGTRLIMEKPFTTPLDVCRGYAFSHISRFFGDKNIIRLTDDIYHAAFRPDYDNGLTGLDNRHKLTTVFAKPGVGAKCCIISTTKDELMNRHAKMIAPDENRDLTNFAHILAATHSEVSHVRLEGNHSTPFYSDNDASVSVESFLMKN